MPAATLVRMNDIITIRGTIGTDPKQIQTATGLDITTFRIASNHRRFDREKGEWIEGETNWYGVSAYRALARNCANSLRKGDPVVVIGKIKIRAWESAEKKGLAIEIDADAIGHNLMFGTGTFTRTARKADADKADDSTLGPDDANADATPDDAHEATMSAAEDPVPTPF